MSTASNSDNDDDSHNEKEVRQSGWLREARHNPCLMRPLSALVMFVLMLVSAITMLLYIPSFLLGLVVSPLARRSAWFIEFFYPLGIARWGHFLLVKASSKSKHQAGHSRAMEQRFEVVKGRVYIHMIPQLLDNICYLVLSVSPSSSKTIVAFLVDCGDATAALDHMFEIRDVHYPDYQVDLQMVLCTHKHHDHTAGNAGLLASDLIHVQHVVGGAVEKVPHANVLVANGDVLTLPSVNGNDMNELVQVEVLAMPAHTRGSVVYAMRVLADDDDKTMFLFAGDTMFSGGGGVPFEADTETPSDSRLSNKNGSSHVKPSAGSKAVERCFAEIIHRGAVHGASTDAMLVLPGHEYTADLIARQFRSSGGETTSWKQMPPAVFFETASEYYVAAHRRALPHNGKLFTVPSVVSRELYINPHYRSLRKRGDHIVRALRMWYRHFSKEKMNGSVDHSLSLRSPSSAANVPKLNDSNKTPCTETEWNLTMDDITRPIFTTVFSADLESVIDELSANKITPQKAAKRLRSMQSNLQENLIGRRPIPGTLPTDKGIYQGILALAILGSGPCAMTLGDAQAMNLPIPMDRNSDCILISKRRLIGVLNGLELLTPANDGNKLVQMIELLWKDASEYCDNVEWAEVQGTAHMEDESFEIENGLERVIPDEIELGILKWCMYGAQSNQPSWFTKFCMLTSDEISKPKEMPVHPVETMTNRRTNGELVRHDVLRCPLCRDAAGCPAVDAVGESYATTDDESPRRESSLAGLPEESASAVSSEIELSGYARMESGVSLPFDENGETGSRKSAIKSRLSEA